MNNILEKFWLVVASISTVFTIVIGIIDSFKGISHFFNGLWFGLGSLFHKKRFKKEVRKNG